MFVLAAAADAHRSGTQALLALAGMFAMFSYILWAFKRRKGGRRGGSDPESFGGWILLIAVVVGILLATGRGAGSHPHQVTQTHEDAHR
jgi:hypothetical protein